MKNLIPIKRKFKLFFILLTIYLLTPFGTFAQFKILSNGSGVFDSEAVAWESALRTRVHNSYACAYHLTVDSNNVVQDVFFVSGQGYSYSLLGGYSGSDRILKEQISPLSSFESEIIKLRPVQYKYKNANKSNDPIRYGFIAQELSEVLPNLVKKMPDGTLAINYTDLIPILVKNQQNHILQIDSLESEVQSLKESIEMLSSNSFSRDTKNLIRVYPNPIKDYLKIELIGYILSERYRVVFTDLAGKFIYETPLSFDKGTSVEISTSSIENGLYLVSVLHNGDIIYSKKMVVLR